MADLSVARDAARSLRAVVKEVPGRLVVVALAAGMLAGGLAWSLARWLGPYAVAAYHVEAGRGRWRRR